MIRTVSRSVRRKLSLAPTPPRWSEHLGMFDRSVMLVQVYYVVSLYLLYSWTLGFARLDGGTEGLLLLWPVRWLEWTGLGLGGAIIAHLCLAAGILGAIAWRFFAVRALVSVAILMVMAYSNSHGSISHGFHEWFWISVCFLFLPNARPTDLRAARVGRMQFVLVFGAAPALILLFYTMSGVYKVWYATVAMVQGQFGGFHPEGMANTLAARALETGSTPLWAELVITYPLLGWAPYMALYFIEIVAIAIFFRPVLHRIWGVLLILFHFGTILFMDIPFPLHVLINGLLFLMSPFALPYPGLRPTLAAVPLLGRVLRRNADLSSRSGGARAASASHSARREAPDTPAPRPPASETAPG